MGNIFSLALPLRSLLVSLCWQQCASYSFSLGAEILDMSQMGCKQYSIGKYPHKTRGKYLCYHIFIRPPFVSALLLLAASGDRFSLGAQIRGGD